MLVTRPTLESLLLRNVVDLRFVRRSPAPGRPPTRRMLCTKSYDLLGSTNGRIVLNYRPPKNPKQINESKENVCVVWDILMQNYRVVSADEVDVIKTIPATDEFWSYFNKEILPLTASQKMAYMDS
jgi:hypothetical protein